MTVDISTVDISQNVDLLTCRKTVTDKKFKKSPKLTLFFLQFVQNLAPGHYSEEFAILGKIPPKEPQGPLGSTSF